MKSWKRLEKSAADLLGGVRVQRVTTPFLSETWFTSAPDVVVAGPYRLVCECKYRAAFAHHRLLQVARQKYGKDGSEVILITKEHGQRGACATVRLEFLARLLREKGR